LVAELSLDEVLLAQGGQELVSFEVEVELAADGLPEDLEALGAALEAMGLKPQGRSKFERGMALLPVRREAGDDRRPTTDDGAVEGGEGEKTGGEAQRDAAGAGEEEVGARAEEQPVEAFFAGQPKARQLFEAVRRAVEAAGPAEVKVSKSQVAFRRRRAFAWVWRPEQYLRRAAAPLVLTLSFRERNPSPRWKEIVEAARGRFTHHLELHTPAEIDGEVRQWLREAWLAAG
jgi:inorganic triphosphatase YgiF